MTLRLSVPDLLAPGKFTGNLIVLQNGQEPESHSIVLTRPAASRPARLIVDRKSTDAYNTRSWLPWFALPGWMEKPATFAIQVRNDSEEWQATDVFLRLLEVTTPGGADFEPETNLTLTWNNKEVGDLWRSASIQNSGTLPRSIAPNGQAEISGRFIDLAPGEYTIKIGLAAANAVSEPEQHVTIKV